MYAIGAEVMMLMFNLWIEAGLVNGMCGKVINILKPQDGGNAHTLSWSTFLGTVVLLCHLSTHLCFQSLKYGPRTSLACLSPWPGPSPFPSPRE